MSYAYDPLEEEKRKNQDQEDQMLGGGSGSVLSGQTQAPQSQGNKKGSGQYVNLQNYLNDSNKSLGLDIANRLGQDVQSAQAEQDKAKTDFTQAVDKGTVKKDQSNIDFVISNPYAAKQGYDAESLADYQKQATQGSQTTQQEQKIPQARINPPKETDYSNLIFGKQGTSTTPSVSTGRPTETNTSNLIFGKQSTTNPSVATSTTPQVSTMAPSSSQPLIGGYYKAAPEVSAPTQTYTSLSRIGDPTQYNKFIAQRDAAYGGPYANQDQDYFSNALSKTQAAQEYGRNLTTEQGKKAALQKYYGGQAARPDYTQGQQNLDMYLGFASPEAKQALAEKQAEASKLGDRFSGLQNELNAYRQSAIDQTKAARQAARQAIGIDDTGALTESGPIQALLNATKNRATDLSKNYPQMIGQITGALQNKDISGLSKEIRDQLNLDDVYSLYNTNPGDSKYFTTTDPKNISQSGVTTQEELDRLQALAGLAGINQQWIDPSVAGKNNGSMWKFDSDAYKSDLAKARQNFENKRRELSVGEQAERPYLMDFDDWLGWNNRFLQNDPGREGWRNNSKKYAEDYIINFEKGLGARDVLKAGRQNELMDLSDDLKNDILRGYITPGWQGGGGVPALPGGSPVYGKIFVSNPLNQFETRGDKNAFLNNEDLQSKRGLADYNYLIDELRKQGKTKSDVGGGLPSISDDELIDKYKRGQLIWA